MSLKIEGLAGLESLPRANGAQFDFTKSKREIFDYLVDEMFMRTRKMFKYSGLPETFDANCFERALQNQGFCIVKDVQNTEREKGLYALIGVGLGGPLDASYIPTLAVGANAYLNITINGDRIGKDCVLVKNDSTMMGFSDLNSFYGGMLAEAIVTLRLMLVLHRSPSFITATSEDERRDALKYLADLEEGKLGVIGSSVSLQRLLGGNTLDTRRMSGDAHNSLKECLETIQYLMGQWNIRVGLNDNYNMKREALNSAETEANVDTLFPRVDDMLLCRQKGIEEINRLYGFNGKVELDGAWERLARREEQAEEMTEAEIEATKQEPKEEEATDNEEA